MRRLMIAVGLCVAGGGLAALVTVALDRPSTPEVQLSERAGVVDPGRLATPTPEPAEPEETPGPVTTGPTTRVASAVATPEADTGRRPRQPSMGDLPGGPFDAAQGATDPGKSERSGSSDKYDPKCQKKKNEADREACQDDLDKKAEEQKAKDKRSEKRAKCDEKDDSDDRKECKEDADERFERDMQRIDEKYSDD